MYRVSTALGLTVILLSVGCQAPDSAGPAGASLDLAPWGPEAPPFNLEVILRGTDGGFGHVTFRQANDDLLVIQLDTWIRGLAPNTAYELQRAVDGTLDGECTSTGWLTLGKGLTPQAITTDARGFGHEALWRSVAAFPVGSSFDIHFRVIEQATAAMVLESDCYRFTITQ
jgi:hypothetical protein